MVNPSEARGNTITAREVLDRGAEKIGRELADEPHSPAALREFHEYLDYVYIFRTNKRTHKSDATNLSKALDTLIAIGAVEGEIIEDETTGKKSVEIPKYKLAELWYSGTIG